jgi:hypothetical protein
MALPKLNDSPSYTLEVPSTGQKVTYRPYLVKEEKVLMIAFESGDQKQALRAIADTLDACIVEDLVLSELTTFDIEYMFTQVRSKSVGEVASIVLPCSSCEAKNEIDLDVSSIKVDMPEVEWNIELTPSISVEMKYPSYEVVMDLDLTDNETEVGFKMIAKSISAILTEDERIDTRDVSESEVMDFIGQMTTDQFQKVSGFLQKMPALQKEVKFQCIKCGEVTEQTLKGVGDFLS